MNVTKALMCKRLLKSLKNQGLKYKSEEIAVILDAFSALVIECVVDGQRIELRGFGSFEMIDRKAKIGRNPRSGELIHIEAYQEPAFNFFKTVKKSIAEKRRLKPQPISPL